ncbi:hypothetical protein G6R29_05960 [Fructobacillus sp. M2-14]|uniref:Uncharacterized protein n=1 Tax=Fructobacillus broussonetiae TaxID=2713173 RepID=A0ABS5R3M4_9LACO|nr:hypothetical protein [Fructobacillus broussonetiae]MBS9339164.1 hypothetical protein [Fructobacillus broussonetiae]
MKIKDLKLKRKDYWVSVEPLLTEEEALKDAEAMPEYRNRVMDYRVLSFSFEDFLIIEWPKAFPGPNPLDILQSRFLDEDIEGLAISHGIITFEATGIKDKQKYMVFINTVRS